MCVCVCAGGEGVLWGLRKWGLGIVLIHYTHAFINNACMEERLRDTPTYDDTNLGVFM